MEATATTVTPTAQSTQKGVRSPKEFAMTPDKQTDKIGLVLLHNIARGIEVKVGFGALDSRISNLLKNLVAKDYLNKDSGQYKLTDASKAVLLDKEKGLTAQYLRYLAAYDVFATVDTINLQFGIQMRGLANSDEEFAGFIAAPKEYGEYLKENGFQPVDEFYDLRIGVYVYEGGDPFDIVFMQWLQEGKFNYATAAELEQIASSPLWNEMDELLNGKFDGNVRTDVRAWRWEETLGKLFSEVTDADTLADEKAFMEDLITTGRATAEKIYKEYPDEVVSSQMNNVFTNAEDNAATGTTTTTTTTTETTEDVDDGPGYVYGFMPVFGVSMLCYDPYPYFLYDPFLW